MTSFSERLEFMMAKRGYKQADLVRKSGMSKAVISTLLSDPLKDLRVASLLAIAKALGCDPLWLYTGKESGTIISDVNVTEVPVWSISDLRSDPIDGLLNTESDRCVFTDRGGQLIGVIAEDNSLSRTGILPGDICVIDLDCKNPAPDNIALVEIKASNRFRLLRVMDGLEGICFSIDDPRLGIIPEGAVTVYGRMVELTRTVDDSPQ